MILQEMVKDKDTIQEMLQNLWKEGSENISGVPQQDIENLFTAFKNTLESIEQDIIKKVIQGEDFDINKLLQDNLMSIKNAVSLENIDWIDVITELNLGGKLRTITSL